MLVSPLWTVANDVFNLPLCRGQKVFWAPLYSILCSVQMCMLRFTKCVTVLIVALICRGICFGENGHVFIAEGAFIFF